MRWRRSVRSLAMVATARPTGLPIRRGRVQCRLHAFARHWSFRPQACAPYRARTKGKSKDERGVGYVKKNAIAARGEPPMPASSRSGDRGPSPKPPDQALVFEQRSQQLRRADRVGTTHDLGTRLGPKPTTRTLGSTLGSRSSRPSGRTMLQNDDYRLSSARRVGLPVSRAAFR